MKHVGADKGGLQFYTSAVGISVIPLKSKMDTVLRMLKKGTM